MVGLLQITLTFCRKLRAGFLRRIKNEAACGAGLTLLAMAPIAAA
ncbi:MAG: hypothetical protein ACK5ZB_03950 [bacterium]